MDYTQTYETRDVYTGVIRLSDGLSISEMLW
mgnify:CR=1 FL=1